MLQPPFRVIDLAGDLESAGSSYGAHFAAAYFATREPYLAALSVLNGVAREAMHNQAQRWLTALPTNVQLQMAAMAEGIRTNLPELATYLYADISSPYANPSVNPAAEASGQSPGQSPAPLCSTVVAPLVGRAHHSHPRHPWVARNCDWYPVTLCRGTAMVIYRSPGPGRMPFATLGVMGDIDADTGINAAGLWLHMHTQYTTDVLPLGQPSISWLFWMREALETCATIAEVEHFARTIGRDRGIMLIAVEGASGKHALFECGRSTVTRIDPHQGFVPGCTIVTNHCLAKHPMQSEPERRSAGISKPNSTVRRYNRLLELLSAHRPEHAPDDLIEILADDDVEIRAGSSVQTIYSAVAHPHSGTLWFASEGTPAASQGRWRQLDPNLY